MKRTLAIFAFALALTGATTGHRLDAQTRPDNLPVESVEEALERIGKTIHAFVAKNQGAGTEKREALRNTLRPLVGENFDARQRLQKAELGELRRRLADIEQAIHVREKNRAVIINARLDELLSGQAAANPVRYREERTMVDGKEVVTFVPFHDAPTSTGPSQTPPAIKRISVAGEPSADGQSPVRVSGRRPVPERRDEQELPSADYDIETRERLAQIDVRAALDDFAGADKEFQQARALWEQGTMSAEQFRSREKDRRHASDELERAKARLNGLARWRTELEEAAADVVADALAHRVQAAAKLAEAEAALETGRARHAEKLAAVDAARAKVAHEQKRYDRIKELFKEKAVDEEGRDKSEAALDAAKGDLGIAIASSKAAKGSVAGLKAAMDAVKAELQRAERRVEAAEARLDRLKRPAAKTVEPLGAQPAPTYKTYK